MTPSRAVTPSVIANTHRNSSIEAFESAFQAGVDRYKVPVAVAVVTDKTQVLLRASHGNLDSQSPKLADGNSIFLIASMTKAVTSVAALQLVERGLVQLDAPAGKYLAALKRLPILEEIDGNGRPHFSRKKYDVTLRQLLSHTAGFAYAWNHPLVLKYGASTKPFLVHTPGSRWHYGTNIDWVGRLVEAVSGQTLEAYFREHILDPLGMDDTSFLLPVEKRSRMTTHYQQDLGGALWEVPRAQLGTSTNFNGGGGLLSTPDDYSRFTRMILREGAAANGQRILSPESIRLMASSQTSGLDAGTIRTTQPLRSCDVDFHPGEKDQFGLGFLINPKAHVGGRSAGSLAWGGLLNTFFWIDPEREISAVLMMNFLPFCDDAALNMLRHFERSVYTCLR